jgi:DNA/RNA endonuclease YhcR with UshA esterase domain
VSPFCSAARVLPHGKTYRSEWGAGSNSYIWLKETVCEGEQKTLKPFLVLAFCIVANLPVQSQTNRITAAEARNHVGERATVCGQVASARYADRSKGQPTFLNLDAAYPTQIFTIVIWGSDRAKFGEPETKYRDKRVCASGVIKNYRGTPEIETSNPKEIEIQK